MRKRCDYCNDPIRLEDQFIDNKYGQVLHYECAQSMRLKDLLEWLDVDIQLEEYPEDY